MRVAPAAFAAAGREITLARLCKVKEQLVAVGIKDLCTDRDAYQGVGAVLAVPVRSLSVTAAFSFVLRIVAKVEQGVEPLGRLEPDAAADAAVAAGRASAGNEFFTAKGRYAVAAVAGRYVDLYSV
jgi:hypothetical protein